MAAKVCIIPTEIKNTSLNRFKELMELWKPTTYPCRLSKTYANGLDFL